MPAPLDPRYKAEARKFRRQGMAVKAIASELGVSPSSVSHWVRDVELTADQRAQLLRNRSTNHEAGVRKRSQQRLDARRAAQAHGRELALTSDPLHLAGCMLYWAEGAKQPNSVCFVNSDAAMLELFLCFLFECYEVDVADVRLQINCFLGNGLTIEDIENWWLEQLHLPRTALRKPIVNRPSRASKGIRRPLLYGTAAVVVHSTFVVQSIFGAIQKYGSFERPELVQAARRRDLKRPDLRAA